MFASGMMKAAICSISCSMAIPDEYLEFNEITDVVASVRLIAMLGETVKREPILWKWIVLAAFSALQGAMVCNLGGTSTLGALDEKSRKLMLEHMESDDPDSTKPPKLWLANFDVLLEWIQDPLRSVNGATWKPAKAQLEAIGLLKELRNDFTHFKNMRWAIQVAGLPRVVQVVLDGVETLMLKSNWLYVHIEDEELELLKTSLSKARQAFR